MRENIVSKLWKQEQGLFCVLERADVLSRPFLVRPPAQPPRLCLVTVVGSALQAFARMEAPPALHEADDSRPLDGPHFVHVPRSVARWEHKTRKLSGAFGSPHLACCTLGGAILLLNVLRSHCFTQAMLSQPRMQSLDNPLAYRMGLALLGVGGVFVLSSFLALGFTGTFLGDYFGILKETRVTTFPFSVLDNPMYWGSTANYLGWAIMHASPAGLLLTTVVALTYTVAILYEEPFTAEIYRQKASQAHKRS
ncbi:phosphatidylethanolamine N-methyltransferase isoform X2 [Globicephala melas]|uniref:phosphatidylethanolamine N-methyltransferase isoform X2 n=1 Tax=Globicephala melas TaxID=9731 RepID=UPI00293D8D16|nr:phosphatidylethanolamine N-methyltransferase isoform X2 [Globicephala melas]